MKIVSISEARRFTLDSVQRRPLETAPGISAELICFEAGQVEPVRSASAAATYQVLEGEAMVRSDGAVSRLGKGKLASVPAGEQHTIENAGGGLLVILAISAG
ncbi:MAG TPA: cupin domain-containing protein [Trueperaceae bacterium]|nr:cupin domain-containing protein [Trueperaceae bacterium]